jgi:tetratricopeptide (TPR) repeat protein
MKAAASLAAVALLAGCAAPRVSALIERPPQGLPAAAEIADTPFFPQQDAQCGPASLAAVLRYAGREATPEALRAQVYLPGRQGSLQAEMLAATRRHGLVAYVTAPRLEDLLRELAAGTPAVVLQNLALDWAPLWHYAVAIGYDLDARQMILRSGTTRRQTMSLDTFERTWARSGHWAMLALPPERLPASAAEQRYLGAVAALERADPGSAERAYGTALERWPSSLNAQLGLGNARYGAGDLDGAARAYRRAAERQPGSADAWNNLAQALLDLGERPAALAAARRAVAIGGARMATYRETLVQIQRRRDP